MADLPSAACPQQFLRVPGYARHAEYNSAMRPRCGRLQTCTTNAKCPIGGSFVAGGSGKLRPQHTLAERPAFKSRLSSRKIICKLPPAMTTKFFRLFIATTPLLLLTMKVGGVELLP